MKWILFCAPLWLITDRGFDTTHGHMDFGQGTVVIECYASHHFYDYSYLIKGNRILRDDRFEHDAPQETTTDTTVHQKLFSAQMHLTTRIMPEKYVIDWGKQWCYQSRDTISYVKHRGFDEPLDQNTAEPFYRMLTNLGSKKIIHLPTNTPVKIDSIDCLQGLVVDGRGDSTLIYYTKSPMGVHSPLNCFAPAGFPYEVLGVKSSYFAASPDGQPRRESIVYKVKKIQATTLPDSLFQL